MFHILLDSSEYPNTFHNIELPNATNLQKQQFAEQNLINKIKSENFKINDLDIIYCDIDTLFPNTISVKTIGLLVEECIVHNDVANLLVNQNCYVHSSLDANNKVVYRIKFYLFFSATSENTRSAFVSQVMFPQTLDFSKKNLKYSSFYFSNHPIYFINMLNKKITAPVLLKEIATLIKSGIRYIELFHHKTLSYDEIDISLGDFLQKYYNLVNGCTDNKSFYLDSNAKTLKLKIDALFPPSPGNSSYVVDKGTKWDFNGSSEKFYWNNIFWLAIILTKEGYQINTSDLDNYLTNNSYRFGGSDKIFRFESFLKYMKKIDRKC